MFKVEYEIPSLKKKLKGKRGQKEFLVEGLIAHPDNKVEVRLCEYYDFDSVEIEKVEDGKVVIAKPLDEDQEITVIAHGVPKLTYVTLFITFGHGESVTLTTTNVKANKIISNIENEKKFMLKAGENRFIYINSEFVQYLYAHPCFDDNEDPNELAVVEHLKKWDVFLQAN